MRLFVHVALFAAKSSEEGCPGPFPGWLSGPPMNHNELAPLPVGRGFVLCCHGSKGATPDTSYSYAVTHLLPHPDLFRTTPVVILSARAECPGNFASLAVPSGAYIPQNCEPFLGTGCSVTESTGKTGGCPALHGFPKIDGHGGCSSSLQGSHGWIHTKCCSGEIGHVGPVTTMAPTQPHLKVLAFSSLRDCLGSQCYTTSKAERTMCRCTFPSHVCSSKGDNSCTEFPKGFTLNQDGMCGTTLFQAYRSVEDCAAACELDDDCGGFQIEKMDMKTCRLFFTGECQNPQFSVYGSTHVAIYNKRAYKHTEDTDQRTTAVTLLFLFYLILVLPVIVVFVAATCIK